MKGNCLVLLLAVAGCTSQPQGCTSTPRFPDHKQWCNWRLPLFGTVIAGVAGPDPVKITDNGSGSDGVYGPCYASNFDENIHDGRGLPPNITTQVNAEIGTTFWWFQNGAGTGNVEWCQEIVGIDVGTNILTSNSTETCITEIASGTSGQVQQSQFALVSVPVTKTSSSYFRFARKGTDTNDTLGVDACIIGIQTDYTCDTGATGSRN
jgi:hypothetical protein